MECETAMFFIFLGSILNHLQVNYWTFDVQQESGQNQIALVIKDLALHLQNGMELAKLTILPATSEHSF